MSTPREVLIARAIHFLELGLLQLKNGAPVDAALSFETSKALLEEVQSA